MSDKKGTSLWIVIVVLVAVLAGGIGWFIGSRNNVEKPNNSSKIEQKEQSKEEVITDEELKKDLGKKTKYLFNMDLIGDSYVKGLLFEKSRTIDEISEQNRVLAAFYSVKRTNVDKKYEDGCYNLKDQTLSSLDNCSEHDYSMVMDYVNADDVANMYYYLFGEKFYKKDIYEGCPVKLYQEKNNVYYFAYPCGGTGYTTESMYIYDYTSVGDKAYVYVAYGINSCCSEEPGIYTDYDEDNKYTGAILDEFELTEDNYKDFSKYRFVFEKKGNDYYFTAIEKL